jgi:hypothetical protein
MAGVKMLKKALGQGTPAQQAAGLLKVVQAISGNNPLVGKTLGRMLMKGGISAGEAPDVPVEEGAPAAVGTEQNDDLNTAEPDNGNSLEENSALDNRQAKVDKTQAFQMLKKTLGTKPSTQQVDFVVKFINDLNLKDSAKKRLMLHLRKGLK